MFRILILLLLTQSIYAGTVCDDGVTEVDGKFHVTRECWELLGKKMQERSVIIEKYDLLTKENEERKLANEAYKRTIDLQKMHSEILEERVEKWRETTYKVEDRMMKIEKLNDSNKWLWFGIGFISSSLSVYLATKYSK